MIKIIVAVAFIGCFVLNIQAGPAQTICRDPDSKKLYAVGEQWSNPRICAQNVCNENYDISVQSCPLIAVKKTCKFIGEDTSKPFPDCCGRVICPFEN